MKDLVSDYSTKTTIQGIKYVADTNLSWIERIWWTTILIISIFCCGSLISNIFGRYDRTPLIITYENEETMVVQVNNIYSTKSSTYYQSILDSISGSYRMPTNGVECRQFYV
jgi:Amiloride-sensitive sodium channel